MSPKASIPSAQSAARPIFQASPPAKPTPSLAERVLPIAYPPLGLYLLFRKISRIGLLKLVECRIGNIGSLVFPAPRIFQGAEKEKWQKHKQAILNDPENGCSSLQVKTADGVKLDGALLWADRAAMDAYRADAGAVDLTGQKWIIHFNGNAMCYESAFATSHELRQQTGHHVLLFNYRGVIDSEGSARTADDLVLDGDAFVQYLLSRGVRSQDILIDGFSLGGGVGTQVRALHPEGPIVNFQSFSSIAGVVTGLTHNILTRGDKQNDGLAANACAAAIGFVAAGVLDEAGWALDSADKWAQIQGYKWIVSADADSLITGKGKLYKAVKPRLKGYKPVDKRAPHNAAQVALNRKLKAELKHVRSPGTGHGGPLTPTAYRQHMAHMEAALR